MNYLDAFSEWEKALLNTEYDKDIAILKNDKELLKDSFYKYLEFGTAGMRGIIGLGTNRMNIFTVRRSTKGLADYINSIDKAAEGVVIAYDSRHKSYEFALETALVLASNGIKAYLFKTLTSVPILSFSVIKLKCAAGVVITASHNPKQYNGYKVYGADGGQLANEHANIVMSYINDIKDIFSIKPLSEEEALKSGLLTYVGEELYNEYFKNVVSLCMDLDIIKQQADSLKVVYTPLHGTGNIPVYTILSKIGIKNVYIVPEQKYPDPDFPTVKAPNPEEKDTFSLAIKLANEKGANMILATDPDCDRLGIAVRESENEFKLLTGNQIGCLLLDYILMQNQKSKVKDGFAVKSIVSTNMANVIAEYYCVEMREVLTGFKYIAEQINLSLKTKKGTFLFGFEESYGFLAGTFVRDKDAAIASMLVVEAACYYASKNMTLYDALNSLFEKYGYFKEEVVSITLSGIEGQSKILAAVETLRKECPKKIGQFKVNVFKDYLLNECTDCQTNEKTHIDLPKSDVLGFYMDDVRFIIRPSGTEPKLKSYLNVRGKTAKEANDRFAELKSSVNEFLNELTK
ncbi:MAG: phospho-sugar mutase [Eubacteriales bacterium]